MTALIALLAIAMQIFRIGSKTNETPVSITGTDVMHPAEFELRDHYFIRCSE